MKSARVVQSFQASGLCATTKSLELSSKGGGLISRFFGLRDLISHLRLRIVGILAVELVKAVASHCC